MEISYVESQENEESEILLNLFSQFNAKFKFLGGILFSLFFNQSIVQ